MRQGIFTPNRPAISTLRNLLIFLIFVYTPRGLADKAVASELIDRWFESWSGQIFFLFFFIVNSQFRENTAWTSFQIEYVNFFENLIDA